ncbi:MAG TPA: hypothetical protein VJ858_07255 [Acidimicrobiia bacterium]|nr:hypothetical protein [Acidimicrobiia bacterium]
MGSSKKPNRRRLASVDLRVNRMIGVTALLIGALLTYSLVFTSFDERVRFQWNVESDGTKTPMTHITCPSPWDVLVNGAEPEVSTTEGLCVMPSRSLAVEGAIVAAVTSIIAVAFFAHTTRPGPLPPLPVGSPRKEGVGP